MGHVIGIGTVWENFLEGSGEGPNGRVFNGENAISASEIIGDTPGQKPLIETTGGGGTADGHWDENWYNNELMTGYVEPSGNQLSILTIRTLKDLGYTFINEAAADTYSIPSANLRGNGGSRRSYGKDVIPLTIQNLDSQILQK